MIHAYARGDELVLTDQPTIDDAQVSGRWLAGPAVEARR